MFHRIERIQHTGLEKLNQLAYLTVAFGLTCSTNAPEEAIKAEFIAHFATHGYPLAGDWLWGKPVAIRALILRLIEQPSAVKLAILSALEADKDLEKCFLAGHFASLVIPQDCKDGLALVAQILENFYEDILAKNGVPADKIGELYDCNRQTVLRSYLNLQKLKACPGCDGAPPSVDDYKAAIREDIDHFFPKSKYPFWAVHPLNLTPFCKSCNQSYKGYKDAISDQADDVADVISSECIYHPYLRPARGEVAVVVERDQSKGILCLKLKTTTEDAIHQARLHSLNYLLSLESRWNGDLKEERLQEHVKMGLAYCTTEERDNKILTDNVIRQKLKLVADTVEKSIGKIPGQAPTAAYARWLLSDSMAQTEYIHLAQQELV